MYETKIASKRQMVLMGCKVALLAPLCILQRASENSQPYIYASPLHNNSYLRYRLRKLASKNDHHHLLQLCTFKAIWEAKIAGEKLMVLTGWKVTLHHPINKEFGLVHQAYNSLIQPPCCTWLYSLFCFSPLFPPILIIRSFLIIHHFALFQAVLL